MSNLEFIECYERPIESYSDIQLNLDLLRSINHYDNQYPSRIIKNALIPCLKHNNILLITPLTYERDDLKTSIISAIQNINPHDKTTQCIILTPNRNDTQIIKYFVSCLSFYSDINTIQLHSSPLWDSCKKNITKIPQIIISTPYSLQENLKSDKINLSNIKNIILVDVNQLVKNGYYDDILFISEHLPLVKKVIILNHEIINNEKIINIFKMYFSSQIVTIVQI